MHEIDQIKINLSDNFWLLNFCLSFIMFSIALDLKKEHFIDLLKQPKAALAGVVAQYLFFPFIAFVFIKIMQPYSSIALGLLLVTVCPSGNISNFMTATAKGNVALAISLTAISTILAPFTIPTLFTFYANLDKGMAAILQTVHISFLDMLKDVSILLLIPIVLAFVLNAWIPTIINKIKKPIKITALLIFILFLIFAIKSNFGNFKQYIYLVLGVVFLLDLFGFIIGYYSGKLFGLRFEDCKTLSIETGIHNAGLGLILIFSFFDGLGGMALVAAWWGVWHLIVGMAIAYFWKYKAQQTA